MKNWKVWILVDKNNEVVARGRKKESQMYFISGMSMNISSQIASIERTSCYTSKEIGRKPCFFSNQS